MEVEAVADPLEQDLHRIHCPPWSRSTSARPRSDTAPRRFRRTIHRSMAAGRTPMLLGRVVVRLVALLAVAATLAVPGTAESQGAGDDAGPVTLVVLDGTIDRVSARFLERALDEAEDKNSPIVVVRIDTPGGRLDATRDMVGDIFGSTVPVVSYVAPEGAQAASAGTLVASATAFLAM